MTLYVAGPDADALAASATETIVQVVAGSTKPLRIKEVSISFDGVDASKTPIRVDLQRQGDAGTSSSLTLNEQEEVRESPIATARKDFTAEPSSNTDILRSWFVSPAGGAIIEQFPLGDEPVVGPSGRLGIRCTTQSGVTCNALAYIVFDE